jgi:hypothetical protein
VIEGPAKVNRHSVISANHYESLEAIKLDTRIQMNMLTGKKVVLGEGALDPNNL